MRVGFARNNRRSRSRFAIATIVAGWLTCAVLTGSAMAQNARWAIWVMKVDGSQAHMLAQVDGCSRHSSPRWSHDGKRVAFDAEPGSGGASSVYVVNADGSGLHRIGEHARPVWSPDDKQVAFEYYEASGSQIIVQNLDGQGRTQIATGRCPRWSPDGSQIATSEDKDVHITDLISGEVRGLLGRPAQQLYGFSWFPDGKRLAITLRPEPRKHRYLLFVSAQGEEHGVEKRLENELSGFHSFSPDGKKLVIDNQYTIHIVEVDGKSPPVKVSGQTGGNLDPDWSPDGEWLVFSSSRDIP
jgi:Tol biopolymer transport system component